MNPVNIVYIRVYRIYKNSLAKLAQEFRIKGLKAKAMPREA